MPARQMRVPSDGVMAEVYLGITVTSLYTLVGLGLVIARPRRTQMAASLEFETSVTWACLVSIGTNREIPIFPATDGVQLRTRSV